MVNVRQVKSRRDVKKFIEFPLSLYKNCSYFVPPLYSDEKKLLGENGKPDISESVFFLAERDGKVVGRIQGILQKQYNELHNERRIRFTRFDSIDDTEVSRALFSALEEWGRGLGMTHACGPLGYSDLDREGLLIEGFEENSTFEEQYNYEYYGRLLEDAGYSKEVDWLEFELTAPEKKNPMLDRVAKRTLEMNKLHIAVPGKSKKAYIDKYKDSFFDCLDECYRKLYGTVPISKAQREEIAAQFMLIVDVNLVIFICDENEKVVAFGVCFPGMGDALKKSGGRLTPAALVRLMKLLKNPKVMDLGLVGVSEKYQNTGVNAVLISKLVDMLCSGQVKSCETNLNLETNVAVMSQWKYFNSRQHKRRRSYLKELESEKQDA